MRMGPGTDYDVVAGLASDTVVSVTGSAFDEEGNLWCLAESVEGSGYILAELLSKTEDSPEMTYEAEASAPDSEPASAEVAEQSSEEESALETESSSEEENAEENTLETENSSEEEESLTEGEADEEESGEEQSGEEESAEEESGEEESSEEESGEEESSEEETEEDDDMELFARGSQPGWSGRVQSEAEFERQLSAFPSSYHAGLRAIHAVYPNYTFTADYVGMDFQELVDAEIEKKVEIGDLSSWKAMYDSSFGRYENYNWDTGEWYSSEGHFTYASREVIEYFVDPRNFLNTEDVYMFMRQSYSSEQTVDDLRSILEGSFLAEGYVPNKKEPNDVRLQGDYAAVIMEAAQLSGCSPFVIAASILLEHGYAGQTPLISGYWKADDGTEYKNYFNFYDIGATGTDNNNVIQNGLEYAKAEGWISRYLSIVDGASWNVDGYLNNNQDTYYYRSFNVLNGWSSLWHQYSTGAGSAYNSSWLMKSALSGNTYAALAFRIPVYDNMPASAASLPEENNNLNNYYFTDMEAEGLTPDFSMANRSYTMKVTGDTVLKVCVPEWATYESDTWFPLSQGENTVSLDVRSQTGYLRTYTIAVTAGSDCSLTVETYVGNRLSISDDTPSSGYEWGDVNGDGKVSALDYVAIKNHIMQYKVISDSAGLSAADTNEDGKISALDYIAIKNYIMSR